MTTNKLSSNLSCNLGPNYDSPDSATQRTMGIYVVRVFMKPQLHKKQLENNK